MSSNNPTSLPGDKLRKAIDEFCELVKSYPDKPRSELLNRVSQKFDLSPVEMDFLYRQLKDSPKNC